jgi:MFS family permease
VATPAETRGSLARHRGFRLLVVGQATSQLGTQVSSIALPLVAVLTLDAGPLQVGLLGSASTISFALIGLPAGAWIDRVPRRPVLIGSDLVRAALLASVPAAAVLHVLTMAQLLLVAFATGFARVFFDVSYQSYLPSLVGRSTCSAAAPCWRRSGRQDSSPGPASVGRW